MAKLNPFGLSESKFPQHGLEQVRLDQAIGRDGKAREHDEDDDTLNRTHSLSQSTAEVKTIKYIYIYIYIYI